MRFRSPLLAVLALLTASVALAAEALPEGVRRVQVLNYPDCLELSNGETRVTLGHHVGGRVLEYEWRGKNALYLDPAEAKWGTPGGPAAPSSAGRFDIGPEMIIPKRDKLWAGAWTAEAIGPRAARLTSQPDEATGVQLIREFRLAAQGTHLSCEQIIRNVSRETKYWAHWSRTFAVHGGIGIVPLTPEVKRFPNGWIMYAQGGEPAIQTRPVDPNVRLRGSFVEVLGPPRFPKIGFDSHAGWFAYVMPHGQAFVKRYASPRDAVYPEAIGMTLCFWYPQASQVPACELEPHGPRNTISPGASASYTEHWHLIEHAFPAAGQSLDLDKLAAQVAREAL
ncbi:MAG: hypothetical protein Q8N18_02575 [Opitutaceae bacterium]|nr:hypothetical protein [Opitutaceae bacterium]